VAGDANTQNCEKVEVRLQNLNVKIRRSYAVTLYDLSTESRVKEGNTTAQYFRGKKNSDYNKRYVDYNS